MKAHIHRYRAPWGTSQCVITAIGCLALVVIAPEDPMGMVESLRRLTTLAR